MVCRQHASQKHHPLVGKCTSYIALDNKTYEEVKIVNCGYCSVELQEGSIFCHSCGTKVEVNVNCKQCNKKLVDGAKFCSHCGTGVGKGSVSDEESNINYSLIDETVHRLDDNRYKVSPEEEAKQWYRQYFSYIGDFKSGYAPVIIDDPNSSQQAGYVQLKISGELKEYVQKNKSKDNLPVLILFSFKINKAIYQNGHGKMIWAGEFNDNEARIASKDEVYTIDLGGDVQQIGENKYRREYKDGNTIIVKTENTYETAWDHRDYIIDFKGKLLRDSNEMIYEVEQGKYAQFQNFEVSKLGLLDIIQGTELLPAKYNNLETLSDGVQTFLVKTTKGVSRETHGIFDPKKGWIFKTKYDAIEFIYSENEKWHENQLLVCNGGEDIDYNWVYNLAIAKSDGTILYEYKSKNNQYAIINGETHVFEENELGSKIVNVDDSSVIDMPDAVQLNYLGDHELDDHNLESAGGSFVSYQNKHNTKQFAVYHLQTKKVTIPFGAFDEIMGRCTEGVIKVSKNKLWGFVNLYGRIEVPLMYTSIRDEYSLDQKPLILVYYDVGKWFYINYQNFTDNGVHAINYIAKKREEEKRN